MNLALVLLLAQTCVAEIGFSGTPDECIAMLEINARNATRRQVDVIQHTHEFNSYWKSSKQRAQRPWIARLGLEGAEPEGWPAKLRWDRHSGRWLAVVARVRQFVRDYPRGRHRAVCPGADDYGGDPDDARGAEDAKPCRDAVRIRCIPDALQAYWRLAGCRAARRELQRSQAPSPP